MAAAVLERFNAGVQVVLFEGSSGVLDIAVDGKIVYSKEPGIKINKVNEQNVCKAVEKAIQD